MEAPFDMAWRVWPKTNKTANDLFIPLSCLYTPLDKNHQIVRLNSPEIRCRNTHCLAFFNRTCEIDYNSKDWRCSFCSISNNLGGNYEHYSYSNPLEQHDNSYDTIEYCKFSSSFSPVYLFVIDACISQKELDFLKNAVTNSVMLLPQNCLIGLVIFGKNVNIYELSFADYPKSFAFNGAGQESFELKNFHRYLGLTDPSEITKKFLIPVSDADLTLTTILDELGEDPWPVESKNKRERCSGKALELAIDMLKICNPPLSGRLMFFTGGPCTVGNGIVVGLEIKESIRSHLEISESKATYFEKASKFYKSLSEKIRSDRIVVDIFACALDQVGFAEMKPLTENSGGYAVMCESFGDEMFRETIRKIFAFASKEEAVFGAALEVIPSKEFKIAGAIGPISYLKSDKNKLFSTTKTVGVSGTNTWGLGNVTQKSTVAVYFDIPTNDKKEIPKKKLAHVQFITKYTCSNGNTYTRVSTYSAKFADMDDTLGKKSISENFSQLAAAVLLARTAVFNCENEYCPNPITWIDQILVNVIEHFGMDYNRNISTYYAFLVQFVYHFRRSPFLTVFNSSPDETAFYRMLLLRETIDNSVTMICPSLQTFDYKTTEIKPASLELSSLEMDKILMLDTFFNIVIWRGKSINTWIEDRLYEDPQYSCIKDVWLMAENEAEMRRKDRMPHPNIIRATDFNSESRHLIAKLNPPKKQKSGGEDEGESLVFTEDVDLETFVNALIGRIYERRKDK